MQIRAGSLCNRPRRSQGYAAYNFFTVQIDRQTDKQNIYVYKRCDVVLFYSAWNKKMQEKDYSCRFGPKSRCRTNLPCNNELPWSVSFPPPELGRLAPSGLQLYLASGSEEISEAVLSPYIKNYLLIVLN